MNFSEKLKDNIIYLDGAMGTQLQNAGLGVGELPEEWNVSRPEVIRGIHRAYLEAGSDVIYTNTFGANCLKFGDRTEGVVSAAVRIAREACEGLSDRYVALDIGPTGKLLKPLGDLDFEDAVSIFKRTVRAGAAAGADLVAVETMNDCYELKAAVLAAREACNLPVIATFVFGADGKTMTGTSPEAAVAIAEGLGVSAVGINCSLAPSEMTAVVKRMLKVASVPVIVKPNAGLPEDRDGATVYSLSASDFARDMAELVSLGARVVGGCCGTTPEYIARLKAACAHIAPLPVTDKALTVISSYTHAVYFGENPVLIGERINPTGKKRLKQALKEGELSYVLGEAVKQEERGAHALDVNVGLPELNEPEVLEKCVSEIQAVTDLPLQIDTSDPVAMERALRRYNGCPLINSVNGKKESMREFFPLAAKYGGAIICLTLDEGGIPDSAEDRVRIARKIIRQAAKYGIGRNRLIFDTLATAVSADSNAANVTLGALEKIRKELGCNTSLGISNVSFGLPQRDFITASYFSVALSKGLSAAIYNPYSDEVEKAYRTFMALSGRDKGCGEYISFASSVEFGTVTRSKTAENVSGEGGLKYAVIKGLKDVASAEAKTLLATLKPLEVIDGYIIPALDEVGKGFENKTIFLPQLLMSAEAASAAFEEVRARLNPSDNSKGVSVVIATVKGDIHDIGKNIVATLLRNYGFTVYDLGRDVPPERVVEETKRTGAKIVGLSALMTTTVPNMKETVELVKRECPWAVTVVGGAVLNEEYAAMIGADRYCRDAMETVRYAEEIERSLN